MKAPIESLSKREILAIHKWRCPHGHTGLVHYNCWRAAQGKPERIGFIDIETSNLDADFGIMFSWCILDSEGITGDLVTRKDMESGILDKRIVESCLYKMKSYDRLVGHYSRKFDLPYIRSRALYWRLDKQMPAYGSIALTDTWEMAKTLLKISSNRQGNIAEFLSGRSRKTRISSKYWIPALQGDTAALQYIYEHNMIDVKELRANYNRLRDFARQTGRSI